MSPSPSDGLDDGLTVWQSLDVESVGPYVRAGGATDDGLRQSPTIFERDSSFDETFLRAASTVRVHGYGVAVCSACGERVLAPVVIRGERRGQPLKPFRRCRVCGRGRLERAWTPALGLSTPWPARRNVSPVSDTPTPTNAPDDDEPTPVEPVEPVEDDSFDDHE